jgi:hypothetical protein
MSSIENPRIIDYTLRYPTRGDALRLRLRQSGTLHSVRLFEKEPVSHPVGLRCLIKQHQVPHGFFSKDIKTMNDLFVHGEGASAMASSHEGNGPKNRGGQRSKI